VRKNGLPEEFANVRTAERQIKNRSIENARPIKRPGGKFGILVGGDDKAAAAMERHGDLVETPRGEDRSAAASLAARDEVATQRRASAQSTIDDVALEFGSEIQKRIEDIPFYAEGNAALKARATERTDYADIKPESMAEPEMLEIDEMRKAGELDEVDEAMMREADEIAEAAENYAVSYETLAGCVVRHG
jgi:hypothetical protein